MIEIAGEGLSASINPFGAELSHLRDRAGRELMTEADPTFWTGRAPLLFPIVGALNGGSYRLDGGRYALPKHGFARTLPFESIEEEADRAVLRLVDSAATRAVYPFAFSLDVEFWIEGGDAPSLAIEATVTNRGAAPMPASFGYHPAFAWPLPYGEPREEHSVRFAVADADTTIRRLDGDGLIAAEQLPSPLGEDGLVLRDELFAADALIWPELASRRVRYGGAEHGLVVDFPDAPMLGVWTKPGARYVCIEPWWGIADPAGFDGEIWDKPGIVRLAPGEVRTFAMQVTLRA